MKIKVTDGKKAREYNFREGTLASEAIAALGFDFPMPCGGKGRCGKCLCMVNGRIVFACKTPLFADSTIEIPSIEPRVLTAEGAAGDVNGIVIDIGTTTVAAAMFRDGKPVKLIGRKNPQCSYGADVLSRIGADDPALLTAFIRVLVNGIRYIWGRNEPTVIVGNTAMLALYAGLPVRDMGVYPFEMPSRFDLEIDGAYLPPCASAFVGADALCSLLWSGAVESGKTAVMADLGTNGEIALVKNGKIYFTSAAAGPALEGDNISRGMAASDGAICHVGENGFETVNGKTAVGICGSGLIDAVALMLKTGAIDEYGTLSRDWEIHSSGVFITQEDIRAYQLCKAAISAAVKTLLTREKTELSDVEDFFLSGALGDSISVKNAIYTGLLPQIQTERFHAIGNGALMGGALLLAEENRKKLRRYAAECETVNLASDPEFTELYINEMNFNP